MAMDGLRGYLLLASGLAEMSRAKATEAASALLSLSSGLTGGRSEQHVQVQVQDLAEELLAAAAANRRSLIALVRSEVERAMARSARSRRTSWTARGPRSPSSRPTSKRSAPRSWPTPRSARSPRSWGWAAAARPSRLSPRRPHRPASSDDGVVVDAAFTGRLDEPVAAPPRRRPPRSQISDRRRPVRWPRRR